MAPETPDVQEQQPLWVVGIGGSAGSLQPLLDFFSDIPDNTGIAFVIVAHADSGGRSQLPEIVARRTSMPVQAISDGSHLMPDHVYIVPGDLHASLVDDALQAASAERHGAFDVIDFFFRSLAQSRQERAIGVLLSGSGSDGAQGLREIRMAGGLSIVQDPREAEYKSMPAMAIRTGFVDRVLEISKIPQTILNYTRKPPDHIAAPDSAAEDVDDADTIEAIINFLYAEYQADFRFYKRSTIGRRIARRMGLAQVDDLRTYRRYLSDNPEEARELARDMLVGVTSFFRDPEAFEELRERVIRPLIQAKESDEEIRIWCPGVATGEEAYSIGMMVHDEVTAAQKNLQIKMFACDIDEDAIQFARHGIYPETIRADVPERYLSQYFRKRDHSYQVVDDVRDDIIFTIHNMLSDPPFSHLDLVSCRNVLIYIEPEAQQQLFRVFAFALDPGGYLFLGRSDASVSSEDLFTRIDGNARLLRRTSQSQAVLDLPNRSHLRGPRLERSAIHRAAPVELAQINQDVLLAHFSAAVVLLLDGGEVLHFFGPTGKYLEHPTGAASLNLFGMLPSNASARIRGAVRQALEQLRSVTVRNMSITKNEHELLVDVTVMPIQRAEREQRLLAIIFESPWRREVLAGTTSADGDDSDGRVQQLESDLEATRQDLQATIRDLERSNEDFVTANEEIMSMNEELQSANEELETSKEELQSVNEELTTVNQELNEKVDQLTQTNADLESLLEAADIMAIFLTPDLNIRRFSNAATRLLNLISTDVGRPIAHIVHKLRDVDLPGTAAKVVGTGERVDEEVQDTEGNWYLMRVEPYATEGSLRAAVVNFTDVTRVKSAEQLAERRTEKVRELARQITEAEQAERQRIASLIHDEIQQMLAGAKMQLKTAARSLEGNPAQSEAARAAELVEGAIELSRTLTSHLSPPVLRDAGFIAALNWVAAECERMHGIKVEVQIDNRSEPGSETLALFLVEAAKELLFNVAKHAETDRAQLRLARDAGQVLITVRDRGKGFDACHLSDTASGLGFGLVGIMRRLELLGGELDVASVPGNGCTATLRIPSDIFDRPGPPLASFRLSRLETRAASANGRPVRVLIVDDHEIMRDGLEQMLAPAEDVEVVGKAADGREAVEMAEGLHPDVILMDIGMKPMNGIEATRIIMQQHPEMRVIGLSVHEEGELSAEMAEAGAAGFLTKGAPIEEIIAAIRGKAEQPAAGNEPPAT